MSDTRWRQVKALFEAAVERPPAERAAFVAAASGEDEALRREVDALLAADGAGLDLTKRLPAHERATPAIVQPPGSGADADTYVDEAFARLGPYRIVALVGAGGMGEVFRARDSKLNRDVALKLLPAAYALDPDRIARFRREAQALAALNHPHIAAIYGLEEANGRHALVLELVEGATLADRIKTGPLATRAALTLAHQIAQALEAAHEKGIVHRDLKPANIKVTPGGVVKVLDFGLAKTIGDLQPTTITESPARPSDTRLGTVLGTAAYMSPEQARGEEVDARTDIWAFGCVLFEMLAGRRAFEGDSAAGSIAKVLDGAPDWSRLPRHTPARVQALLRRCLQKDRASRPQTIREVRVVIERLMAPASISRTWAAMAAVALVACGAALFIWLGRDRTPWADRSRWVQLTNLDSVSQPALSPDGRMLAFIRGPQTFVSPGQVYIKALPSGEPVPVTNDSYPKMSPVFAPDGNRIAYTVTDGPSWDTWEVATLRGQARRWLRNASGLKWAGGGNLLFSEIKTGNHMAIVRSDEGRAAVRDVYVPPHAAGMAHRSDLSPDRRWVLIVEMDERGAWLPCRVVPFDGGASRPVGPARSQCTEAAWSPDGRWMYFTADAGDGFHVWRQQFPDGSPEPITSGPTHEEGLAISADGRSLITSVGLTQRSVWINEASGERQVSLEGYAFMPLLSADGRKVCFRRAPAAATGQTPTELWVADLDSGRTARLFPDQLVTSFDVSRDDRVVAAVTGEDGRSTLWWTWLDAREPPRRVSPHHGDIPRFGADGDIIFRVTEGEQGVLHKLPAHGGALQRIGRVSGSVIGMVSPDGRWLSAAVRNDGYVLFSTAGEASRPLTSLTESTRLRWSPDGRRAALSIQYGAASGFSIGRTYVLPVPAGTALFDVPSLGFKSEAELAAVPGVEIIPHGDVALGPTPGVYAFSKVTTTRNLYRIPLE
jgi:serine/threonine protein kinase/Tol biopolymer transport system component